LRQETHHIARHRAARSRPRLDLVPPRTRRPDTDTSTPVELEAETRYLDLDGDGLLDAIEVTERITSLDPNSGERRTLQTIRTLAAGIDEDGEPRLVARSSVP
jgi:hypothetical protein